MLKAIAAAKTSCESSDIGIKYSTLLNNKGPAQQPNLRFEDAHVCPCFQVYLNRLQLQHLHLKRRASSPVFLNQFCDADTYRFSFYFARSNFQ